MKRQRCSYAFLACATLIVAFVPVLHGAQTDGETSEVVVARAESYVSKFLDVFSEVKCTENVEQLKMNAKNKVEFKTHSRYDYLVISQSVDGVVDLQESRLEEQGAEHKQNVSLLVSNGFATQLLVFHPYYRSGFEFTLLGEEMSQGRRLAKLSFRHIRGQRTPSALMLRGHEYPLEMMGTAWVDSETGTVERIESELQFSMEDIGLKALRSSVNYAPVKFHGVADASWLPERATIEVATNKQHWRNTHQFVNYQHFGVETEHKDDPSNTLSKAK